MELISLFIGSGSPDPTVVPTVVPAGDVLLSCKFDGLSVKTAEATYRKLAAIAEELGGHRGFTTLAYNDTLTYFLALPVDRYDEFLDHARPCGANINRVEHDYFYRPNMSERAYQQTMNMIDRVAVLDGKKKATGKYECRIFMLPA